MLERVFSADLDLARLAAAQATARAAEDAEGAEGAAADGASAALGRGGGAEASSERSGTGRAALNGQVSGAALDGLADNPGASEGGSGP